MRVLIACEYSGTVRDAIEQVWLPRYDRDQYPRAIARLTDILLHGIAGPRAEWTPEPIDLPPGCVFASRCALALPECRKAQPAAAAIADGHSAACIRTGEPLAI